MKKEHLHKLADYMTAVAIGLALAWGAVEYFTI